MVTLNSTMYPRTVRLDWIGCMSTASEESILGYRIRYWLAGSNYKEQLMDIDVGLRTYGYIQNLTVNSRYNVRVYAYSRGGVGKMSSPLTQFQMIPKGLCVPGASWGKQTFSWLRTFVQIIVNQTIFYQLVEAFCFEISI